MARLLDGLTAATRAVWLALKATVGICLAIVICLLCLALIPGAVGLVAGVLATPVAAFATIVAGVVLPYYLIWMFLAG